MMKKEKVYTITEAAKKIGVTRQTVRNLIKDKKIDTLEIDCSKKLISADAINEYLMKKG